MFIRVWARCEAGPRRRQVPLAVVTIVGVVLYGVAPGGAAARTAPDEPLKRTAAPGMAEAEVASLRTSTSRTYRTSRGTLVTRVSADAPSVASSALFGAASGGPTRDCYIASGAGASRSHCNEAVLKVGSDSTTEYRALLRFDLSGLPDQSQIVDATLGMATATCSTVPPISLAVQRLTREWGQSQGPTWNHADPGLSSTWTTPGGDYAGVAVPRSTALASSCTESWFFPARIAQAWAEGAPSLGLIVREATASGRDVLQFGSSRAADAAKRPFFDVEYRPRTGDTQPYTFERRDLGERTSVAVNVANGNLIVRERDVEYFDTDVDYPIDRTYNNLAHQLDPLGTTRLGAGWSQSFDRRITMPSSLTSGRTTVNGPTGELFAYTYDGADAFHAVGEIRPQLLWGTGYLRLADPDSGTSVEFSPSTYSLESRIDARGNTIAYDKTSRAPMTAITDPLTRRTTFTVGAGNVLRSMTDPDGGIHSYGYDTAGYLTSYTHPLAGTARYVYGDAAKNLTSITMPGGSETRMTYDAQMRVRTLTRITDPVAGTGETTRYDYAAGSTTSTDPAGRVRRYWYDGASRVGRVADGSQPPAVTVSGPLSDARGTTLPAGAKTLELAATNAAGISEFRIDVDGVPVDERPQDCSTACPTSATASWTLDTADYEGGTYTVNAVTTAANGDVRTESFPITAPAQTPFSDGTLPGDIQPTPDQEEPITTDDCESYYGRGSIFCIDPATPLAVPSLTDGGAVASRSTSSLIYGISQDGPTGIPSLRSFDDLRVKRVRRIVNYNLMEQETPGGPRKFQRQINEFQDFYDRAILAGADIMVSFQFRLRRNSRGEVINYDQDNYDYVPGPHNYVANVRAFSRRFKRVKTFSAWNEPNHPFQPTRKARAGPRRAALYTYLLEKHVCAPGNRCQVVAGDMHMHPGNAWLTYFRTYAESVRERFRAARMPMPAIWATHPYTDVRLERSPATRTTLTDKFIDAVPLQSPRVWLTEAGSRIDTEMSGGRTRANTEASQAREVRYLVDRLATSRAAIARVYYYSLCAPVAVLSNLSTQDSGLLGAIVRPGGGNPGACDSQPARQAYRDYKDRTLLNPNG